MEPPLTTSYSKTHSTQDSSSLSRSESNLGELPDLHYEANQLQDILNVSSALNSREPQPDLSSEAAADGMNSSSTPSRLSSSMSLTPRTEDNRDDAGGKIRHASSNLQESLVLISNKTYYYFRFKM